MKKISFIISVFVLFISTTLPAQNLRTVFTKGVGGQNWDESSCMTSDAAGNIYIGGTFSGTNVDFDPGPGTFYLSSSGYNSDVFILKLDPSGNFIWAKSISGPDYESVKNIVITSSTVYVGGTFSGTNVDFDPGTGTYFMSSAGNSDVYVLKLSLNGNFVSAFSFGGAGFDELRDFTVDNSGNVFVTGTFYGTCDFDPTSGTNNVTSNGLSDIFLSKYTATNTLAWVKTIGGAAYDGSVTIASGSNYLILSGSFTDTVDFDPGNGTADRISTGGTSDLFIEKFDLSGNFQWVKTFGNDQYEDIYGTTLDDNGNIYTTGDFTQQLDFDPGPGTFFLITGGGLNKGSTSGIFMQKLDANGNFVWANMISYSNSAAGKKAQLDKDGNIYLIGTFNDPKIDLDPGADSVFFYNHDQNAGAYQASEDVFIQKLDSNGAFVTGKRFGGSWFENAGAVMIDDSLNVYVTGSYESDTLFPDDGGQNYIVNNGGTDVFIIKYSQTMPLFTPSATQLNTPPFLVSFTVNADDTSNLKWFWSFDDGNFSSLRQPQHTYAFNGTYTVQLLVTDTMTGISDTSSIDIVCTGGPTNPCNFSATLNQSGAAIICASDSFLLSVQAQQGASYSWFFNGISIQGAHSPVYYGKQQGFYLAVVTKGGCSQTTDYFALANYPVSNPVVTVSGTIAPCSNDSVKLSAVSNYSSYLWNTGATTREIYVSQSGRFTVQATDANGCVNTSSETIINASLANTPSICAVTTDGVNPNNIVMWKKEVSQKIDHYKVYKESSVAGVYQLLGTVDYQSVSEFTDTVSNVAMRQYRYKITAVDTCGKESPVSLPHTTMHLMINEAPGNHWNLIWRPYVGFNYSTYNIYRGPDSLNMTKIATISASNTSYTDLTNPGGDIYYQLEVISSDTCSAKGSTPHSLSNLFNTKHASGLGIKQGHNKNIAIRIYPNPNDGRFTVRFEGKISEALTLSVFDPMGKSLLRQSISPSGPKNIIVDAGNLPAGIYFVAISNKDGVVYRNKIVVK